MGPSKSLQNSAAKQWLSDIHMAEPYINAILCLVAPQLSSVGMQAIRRIKAKEKDNANVQNWPSNFTNIGVIINRKTPDHRDTGGYYPWYDMLVAGGDYDNCKLEMGDIGASFNYTAGTVVALCGKLLRHRVNSWAGERICHAHYTRNNVINRLGLIKPTWVQYESYKGLMSKGFVTRANLL